MKLRHAVAAITLGLTLASAAPASAASRPPADSSRAEPSSERVLSLRFELVRFLVWIGLGDGTEPPPPPTPPLPEPTSGPQTDPNG